MWQDFDLKTMKNPGINENLAKIYGNIGKVYIFASQLAVSNRQFCRLLLPIANLIIITKIKIQQNGR